MTTQADALFVQKYNSRLTHDYQPQGFLLDGMGMPEGKMEASKAWWPKYGASVANEKVRGVAAPLANPDASQIGADLKTFEHLAAVENFDGVRMAVSEEDAVATAATMALGRRVDQDVMGVLNAVPQTASNFFDTSAAQIKAADISLLLAKWMGANNIPTDGQIFGGISMLCHQALMGDSSYANSQWVGEDLPFKQMGRTQGRSWNFVNWVILPDSYFTIPAANKMDMVIWHKPSLGVVRNKKIEAKWSYEIDFGRWKARHESEGCAVVLRNEGVARLRIKTDLTSIVKS